MTHTWWLPFRHNTVPLSHDTKLCNYVQNGLATMSNFTLQLWVLLLCHKHQLLNRILFYSFNKLTYLIDILFIIPFSSLIYLHSKNNYLILKFIQIASIPFTVYDIILLFFIHSIIFVLGSPCSVHSRLSFIFPFSITKKLGI